MLFAQRLFGCSSVTCWKLVVLCKRNWRGLYITWGHKLMWKYICYICFRLLKHLHITFCGKEILNLYSLVLAENIISANLSSKQDRYQASHSTVSIYHLWNPSLFFIGYLLFPKILSLLPGCDNMYTCMPQSFFVGWSIPLKLLWLLRSELFCWLNRVKWPFTFNFNFSFSTSVFLLVPHRLSSFKVMSLCAILRSLLLAPLWFFFKEKK